MVRRSIRIFVVLGLGATTAAAQRAMPSEGAPSRDERFVPRPELARWLSRGFETVVADFYWLQAVQVVGGSKGHPKQQGPLLGRLLDVTTSVDPWVDHPYRFAGIWLTESVESVRTANALLARGISYHPRDWRNRFYLGFNHFFYLTDNAAAAEALDGAMELEGAPRYLKRLLARLRADAEGLETAEVFLRELIRETEDPYARAEYEKSLDEIETERRARFLDAARAAYRKQNGRDIGSVEDLARGPGAVLHQLPRELHGWEWVLDPKTGRIVSSYYKARYQVRFQGSDPVREQVLSEAAGVEPQL